MYQILLTYTFSNSTCMNFWSNSMTQGFGLALFKLTTLGYNWSCNISLLVGACKWLTLLAAMPNLISKLSDNKTFFSQAILWTAWIGTNVNSPATCIFIKQLDTSTISAMIFSQDKLQQTVTPLQLFHKHNGGCLWIRIQLLRALYMSTD